MSPFCRTGVRYDARQAYGLMTIVDGGCEKNYALSRAFKRNGTRFSLNLPKEESCAALGGQLGSKSRSVFADFGVSWL